MWRLRTLLALAPVAALVLTALASARGPERAVELTLLGRHASGVEGGAEIPAYDPGTRRLFVVNFARDRIDVVDIADPSAPAGLAPIDVSGFGSPNSVAVRKGVVAVAIEAVPKTDPGTVAFYSAGGAFLASVRVGALPDMLTFTPDGRYGVGRQ
jgi:hypothetical protein